MRAQVDTVRTPDGSVLLQRTWLPDGATFRAGVLIVHGVGEHAGRYDHVAHCLTSMGCLVRGYDQRGFGESSGRRGALPTPDTLLDDLRFMHDRLEAELRAAGQDLPPFILGHSMGGALVARAVTGGFIRPRGMVLSSPAIRPRLSRLERLAAYLGSRIVPGLQVAHGLPMDRVSHDLTVVRAIGTDTAMHDRVTPRLVSAMVDAGRRALADAGRCHVPSLVLAAGNDHFVEPEAAVLFYAALPSGIGTLHVYAELYHEIFLERAPDRALVLGDLVRWMREQVDGE